MGNRYLLITTTLLMSLFWACSKDDNSSTHDSTDPIDNNDEDNSYTYNSSGTIDNHDFVDLGLSVKWATCNLGATSPLESGNRYAWGETTPWNDWTPANYYFAFAPCSPDYILDANYDAVTANWGESWRMPTIEEIFELLDSNNCDWKWMENIEGQDINGYKVTSKKNGNSLFLPAGHHDDISNSAGYYWSSTAGPEVYKHPDQQAPWTLSFTAFKHRDGLSQCFNGLSIRGVVGSPNRFFPEGKPKIDEAETQEQGITVNGEVGSHTYVDLGLPSRTLWATYNVGATLPHEYGEYYAWGETAPKELYDEETYKFFSGYSESGPFHFAQYSKYIWFNGHGTLDYKLTLDPEDDAATVNWGGQWQMPSRKQCEELATYCKWYSKDVTINNKRVYGFIGESHINGNKIYIPASDFKYKQVPLTHMTWAYWTRDLSGDPKNWANCDDYHAAYMGIQAQNNILYVKEWSRFYGQPVRAVVKQ